MLFELEVVILLCVRSGKMSCEKCYACEELEGALRSVMCVRCGWREL